MIFIIKIGFFAMLWAIIIRRLRNLIQRGSVLLDLGKSIKNIYLFMMVCTLGLIMSEIEIKEGFSVLFLLTFVILWFLEVLPHNKIREQSILYLEFIKWERIKSYK